MSQLRREYLFLAGHFAHVDLTRPVRLNDLFQLVTDIDAYIEEREKQQRAQEG